LKEENKALTLKDYSGGLTKSRNKPTARSTMLKNPKNEVNTPKVVVLVTVKYRNKAPIMVSSKPTNFSASDTQ
jgi:hypothetical protein